MYDAVDLAFLNFASDSYKATLNFVVDSKGNALDAQVKGNNEDVNAFIEAAFYRIKEKASGTCRSERKTGIFYGLYTFNIKF